MRHLDEPAVLDVLDRLKDMHGASSDRELARQLDVPASTVASWRQRESVPYALCAHVALNRGVSLDWLILGYENTNLDDWDGVDPVAAGVALKMMRSSLMFLGEGVDADILGQVFNKLYKGTAIAMGDAKAAGRTREQVAKILYQAVSDMSGDVLLEAFRMQEKRSKKS